MSASDADSEAYGPIRYEIIEGDPLGKFSINPNTGVLKTASILDREVQQTFVLVIEAKDGKSTVKACSHEGGGGGVGISRPLELSRADANVHTFSLFSNRLLLT